MKPKIKNTTRILYDLLQNTNNTKKEIVENTRLSLTQVNNTIKFLKMGGLIKVDYLKTDKKPYRKAIYSIPQGKYKYTLNLVQWRLKNVH